MKKGTEIIIAIIVILLIIILGLEIFFIPKIKDKMNQKEDVNNTTDLIGYVVNTNYIERMTNPVVVTNIIELNNFLDRINSKEVLTKYNGVYFEKNNLALAYMISNNSSQAPIYDTSNVEGNTVNIYYSIDLFGIGATVMGGHIIVVEVPKKVTKAVLHNTSFK